MEPHAPGVLRPFLFRLRSSRIAWRLSTWIAIAWQGARDACKAGEIANARIADVEQAPAVTQNEKKAMICVENVTRHYGPVVAVDRVSFTIGQGEAIGFLGPNGAGKSTVLKMISTWLPLTAGRIQVAGRDVELEPLAVRRALGYLPEHNALYENMRVDRFLLFIGRMHGLDQGRLEERRVGKECRSRWSPYH